jgi:hypothetical protein
MKSLDRLIENVLVVHFAKYSRLSAAIWRALRQDMAKSQPKGVALDQRALSGNTV